MTDPKAERTESERILSRLENDAAGALTTSRMTLKNGIPSAEEDWIEHWGTRIGRAIGLVITIAIIAWLVLYTLNII